MSFMILQKKRTKGKVALWKTLPVALSVPWLGRWPFLGTRFLTVTLVKHLLKTAAHGTNPAEWMLLVASVGTALSFSKFVYFGFIKGRGKILRN